MSEEDKRTRLKYTSPVVVPLGTLARGAGECESGSANVGGGCENGGAAAAECEAGGTKSGSCDVGTSD
ncbi:MAG TPA: hypothetical protein VEI28_04900 [Thermodesulfovibrionales bacterium]|nr:hypothetical protein [Thermodesulfovibrionales bacterium]